MLPTRKPAGVSPLIFALVIGAAGIPASRAVAVEVAAEPTLLNPMPPVYPRGAFEAKQEGSVKVGFDVTEEGKPINIKVLEASLPGIFDQSAIVSVSRSKYAAAIVDGRKQGAVRLTRTFDFKLGTALLAPKPISQEKPHFSALGVGKYGFCDVTFIVNPDGTVSDPEILRSQPYNVFDKACLEPLPRWKYEPALFQGKPISIPLYYEFTFLQSGQNRRQISYLKPGQWVTVQYTLRPDGTTREVKAIAQSDDDVSSSKAVRQVEQMHFAPIVENAKAVEKQGQTITIHAPKP
jgi:protein TonB